MDLDQLIATQATTGFSDDTALLDAGIESLSLLRLAATAAGTGDVEIDATRMLTLHTVGDLKQWLAELRAGATATTGVGR